MKAAILMLIAGLGLHAQYISAARQSYIRMNDAHSYTGDTWRHCVVGVQPVQTFNDGSVTGTSHNIGLAKLTLGATAGTSSLTGIDVTTDFGTMGQMNINGWSNNSSWKSGGCIAPSNFYWAVFHQCNNGGGCGTGIPNNGAHNVTIMMSSDLTAVTPHLCNPKTVAANSGSCPANATTAAGDPPTGPADSATMWPGASHMGYLQFIGIFNSYLYANSIDSAFTGYYLSRVPVTSIQDVSTWEYFSGGIGGDTNIAGNWCTGAYSGCAASHTLLNTWAGTNTFWGSMGNMQYLGAPLNLFVMATTWLDAGANGSNGHTRLLASPSMSGPFAPFLIDSVLDNQNFQQVVPESLTYDAATGTGTFMVVSGGSYDNAGGTPNYSPYYVTYKYGFSGPASGPRLTAPGLHRQSTSRIQLSKGVIPGGFPSRGLQQMWLFYDQEPLRSTPTLWPFQGATELLTGATVTFTGPVALSSTGLNFNGTSSNRAGTSGNAPSFLTGDGTYSLFAIFRATSTGESVIMSTGNAATPQQLIVQANISATGDVGASVYGAGMVRTPGSVINTSNYYCVGVTRRATGAASTAADAAVYVSGRRVTTGAVYGAQVPNIAAAPLYFGIRSNGGGWWAPFTGNLVMASLSNVELTPTEMKSACDAGRSMAASSRLVAVQQ